MGWSEDFWDTDRSSRIHIVQEGVSWVGPKTFMMVQVIYDTYESNGRGMG